MASWIFIIAQIGRGRAGGIRAGDVGLGMSGLWIALNHSRLLELLILRLAFVLWPSRTVKVQKEVAETVDTSFGFCTLSRLRL